MFYDSRYIYGDQNVEVPAHLNFGKYMLDRLRLMNNEVALENGDTHQTLTYKELTDYAVNLSKHLVSLGVKKGDIVAVGAEKRLEFIPTVLAIIFTGATYTPHDLKSGRAVLRHKLSITSPKYFICTNLFWNNNKDVLREFDCIKYFITLDEAEDQLISVKSLNSAKSDAEHFEPPAIVQGQSDVAFILYSSGTTGMPKGVQLTHLNCIVNSLPNDFKDPSLQTAFLYGEWYHNYDTFMTYKFLCTGKKVVYVKEPSLPVFLKCVGECKVNIALIVPSLVGFCSKVENMGKYNVESLKVIYSRSSPLHRKTIENVKKRFPSVQNILQGYGMTECGEPTSENWGTKGPKPGSVGMASPGLIIKVVDPNTNEILGPNQRGEIRVTGSPFMKGYMGIDRSTYLDEENFFKTGDLGYYDEDKYFYIVDRFKDIIVYDGYKVAPLELESILLTHPGVREAAVIGKAVPDYGEEPTAFIVKQAGSSVTEKELIDYVASEVAPYMQIRGGVIFQDEIPRNSRGKVLRRHLREMLNGNLIKT
ncbi:luciferin 4-monooxygenase-like [Aphomia sociella]